MPRNSGWIAAYRESGNVAKTLSAFSFQALGDVFWFKPVSEGRHKAYSDYGNQRAGEYGSAKQFTLPRQ